MKTILSVLLLVTAVSGCERTVENPLIGRWQSDAAATLIEARGSAVLTPEQVQQLEADQVFGRLVATIDAEQIIFEYDGKRDPSPYRVLEIKKPFVDIELFNSATQAYETTRIEVQGDRILVPSAAVDFREVFVRID